MAVIWKPFAFFDESPIQNEQILVRARFFAVVRSVCGGGTVARAAPPGAGYQLLHCGPRKPRVWCAARARRGARRVAGSACPLLWAMW